MRLATPSTALVAAAAWPSSASAAAIVYSEASREIATIPSDLIYGRSLPDAPNGYAPTPGDCPSDRPTIREASTLSTNETNWLKNRRPQALQSMRTLFQQLNITGLDTNAYFDNNAKNESMLPNVAIAASGGGYRALLNGAGAIAAFDSRTSHSNASAGALSGLLQSSTYVAGLSGGSWLVGSLFVNNFTSVQQIIDNNSEGGSLWAFENSIFEGPASNSPQILGTLGYFVTIEEQVNTKLKAGYNITVTDYWARALSYQLVNAPGGGPDFTFSSIGLQDWFQNGSVPMPLIVADGREPGETIISANSTVYEFSPFDFGTWDPTVYGFAPLRYLGTNFSAGVVPANEQCVRGLDNAGYVMGTSSSLFNAFLLTLNSSTTTNVLYYALEKALGALGKADDDIADYPNPFIGFNNNTNPVHDTEMLTLVDGGLDLQNIPLHPLIQPVRAVDVIFAIDSSADTNSSSRAPNWPNGTSLVATYERQFVPISNNTVFPSIPDQETFVNLGLNSRPTFFGCDAANLTGPSPIIVYLPNAPYSYASNVSTFDPSYDNVQRDAIIQNGYNVATMGNGTLDSQWPTCVGCAILSRSLNRTGTPVPDVCTACFKRYCWDGTRNSTYTEYDPVGKLGNITATSAGLRWTPRSATALAVAVTIAVVLVF
ncbi:lysophospholipase [Myriangium duriaei CBS 260.36]|uniref:Lysophospholipase n=1 Tax=Myriangium duriaei CBS 260.36 TaxID=1168546 RepID=A0A9P4IZN9_9PEZI|nr:lysophospholipase [Myriangium duriaei CBS 260.36]